MREPGAAVQRRQGLGRAAAPGGAGVRAGEAAVPGDARRHRSQLSRGDRSTATSSSQRVGARLVVASVQASIDAGRVVEDPGPRPSRNRLQSVTLLDAITEHGFDAAFGGGRRDEDKARAKERILSFRDRHGRWDPRNQRPEPWDVLNARIRKGEQLRAFPLSNWTELDIWQFIAAERIPLPDIYYSHQTRGRAARWHVALRRGSRRARARRAVVGRDCAVSHGR